MIDPEPPLKKAPKSALNPYRSLGLSCRIRQYNAVVEYLLYVVVAIVIGVSTRRGGLVLMAC